MCAKIARSVARYDPAGLAATIILSDGGNADYVEARYPGRLKYDEKNDAWYDADDDDRWREGRTGEVLRRIEVAMREKYEATAQVVDAKDRDRHKHALNSCNAVKIAHCAQVLRTRKTVAIVPGTFDANPNLLGVENGILDLANNKFFEGRLDLLVAKRAQVRYDPNATCPKFKKYLDRVQPNEAIQKCLSQLVGACLTGTQLERCFIFFHGDGGNGKSVFMRLMQDLLGQDYAFVCRKALIFRPIKMAGEQAAGPNDVADLIGKRLISCAEQKGRHWNLEFIKDYTGGEKQHARQLYVAGFNFAPTGKIIVPANDKPGLDEFAEAIRRRFAMIEWNVTLTEQEKEPFEPYITELKEDLSGILNWALDGLATLKRNRWRLELPATEEKATREYLSEQDQVSAFLDATYEDAKDANSLVSAMYRNFKECWLEETHYVMARRSSLMR
jgi:P4 family phage/plasmid primase-like protien